MQKERLQVKKNIIIFGMGYYGKNTYWKLKNDYNVVAFADNNSKLLGETYEKVPVILGETLVEQNLKDTDIIICTQFYYEIESQLINMGITDYFVMLEGLLYHTNEEETMMPVELNVESCYKKKKNEKNILFVQNAACIRTHKIATLMKNEGYKVFLLYTFAPPYGAYLQYLDVYDNIWGFSSAKGIVDFVSRSDFDVIHCSNEPDTLVNIVRMCNKPVIADTHDMQSIRGNVDINALILEYLANSFSTGYMYESENVAQIARKKYETKNEDMFAIENYVMDQIDVNNPYDKLSLIDNEIHCVYEGGVVGNEPHNHRYFDLMWKKITDEGIHIHFYSQSDIERCKRLESISPLIHYEGSMGGEQLIREMTKYDCGLVLFNSLDYNRVHLEANSINKVYEYLNAGIPLISAGIKSLNDFVKSKKIGIELDFSGDIKKQIQNACEINIESDFLVRHRFTMKAYEYDLANFYNKISYKKNSTM